MWKQGIIVAISLAALIWVFDHYFWLKQTLVKTASSPIAKKEWNSVGNASFGGSDVEFYLDFNQVKERNENYIIRMLTNVKDDGHPDYKSSYKSGTVLLEIDCQKSLYRGLEQTKYKELWAYGSSLSIEPIVTEWEPNSRHGKAKLICERLN